MNGPSRANPRLLLVDDDGVFVDVLARALARRGYAVETARGFHQALAIIDAGPHEFAVVDLKMPGGSGLALVERLSSATRKYASSC